MRLHITVAAFLFLLLLSYEFLLFLSFKIPPIARSTTLRHATINKIRNIVLYYPVWYTSDNRRNNYAHRQKQMQKNIRYQVSAIVCSPFVRLDNLHQRNRYKCRKNKVIEQVRIDIILGVKLVCCYPSSVITL